jgi:hypothetical protein
MKTTRFAGTLISIDLATTTSIGFSFGIGSMVHDLRLGR